jgi:hypothetical protein
MVPALVGLKAFLLLLLELMNSFGEVALYLETVLQSFVDF